MPPTGGWTPQFVEARNLRHRPNGAFTNNNNNRNPLIQTRDMLFHAAFVKLALFYAENVTKRWKQAFEVALFLLSLLCLMFLIYIHTVFVIFPISCLDHLQGDWPHNGILRLEVLHNADKANYTLADSYHKELMFHQDILSYYQSEKQPENLPVPLVDVSRTLFSNETLSYSSGPKDEIVRVDKNWSHAFFDDHYVVEYALEYGYLRLSSKAREHANIPVKLVILDPSVDKCFGNWLNIYLLDHFLGYDDALMASLKNFAEAEDFKGCVRNVVTQNDFIFVSARINRHSFFVSSVIMMVFTMSISILLRYSHHQIFVFIVQFLNMFDDQYAAVHFPVAPLLTVILALVGMEAVMCEFFQDPSVSFYVIVVVWLADQFHSFCCRSPISRRHWLRFFYLYHLAFYAYSYRFKGHYCSLALLTSCLFTLHSMLYFLHRYELPRVLALRAAAGPAPPGPPLPAPPRDGGATS